MFARVKKCGRYEYLQIVENRRDGAKNVQRVICTIGRLDQLHAKGSIETLIRSLSRFSEKVLLILSGKSDVSASAKKIGPTLIFERLWEEMGIQKAKLNFSLFASYVGKWLFQQVSNRLKTMYSST